MPVGGENDRDIDAYRSKGARGDGGGREREREVSVSTMVGDGYVK